VSENKVWEFTVYFGEGGVAKSSKDTGIKTSSLESKTSTTDISLANTPNVSSSLSDEEILRGIRYIETFAGRESKGTLGGYSESRSDTNVLGAYQIKPTVWGKRIQEQFGWNVEDWFNPSPELGEGLIFKQRQDRIAKELLLPTHKKEVASAKLYDTPLGKHLPRGSLEILAQLGVKNLNTFLTTGRDDTAFAKAKQGQILNYLNTSLKLFNKTVPDSFNHELQIMGGVKTKYTGR